MGKGIWKLAGLLNFIGIYSLNVNEGRVGRNDYSREEGGEGVGVMVS